METVGQIVRRRREAMGWTLAALADAVGATKGYLSMIENHRVANPPSRAVIEALEAALRIDDGALRRAADWEATPAPVRAQMQQLADDARQARELASWIRSNTERSQGGGKNLDKLWKSGALRKKINSVLEAEPAGGAKDQPGAPALWPLALPRHRVPLINKVAAGYPSGFTDLDYPARIADDYTHCDSIDDPDAFAATVVGDSMAPQYQEGDIVVFSPAAEVTDGCDCFVRLEPDHECTFKRVFIDPETGRIRLQPLNAAFPARTVEREQVAGMYRGVQRISKL